MNRDLEIRARQTAGRLERLVKKEFGVRWWQLSKEDELRCLRLVQWEEKYRVPLEAILKLLVPIWKKKFSRFGSRGLGVKIPTLVGAKSEAILKQTIAELYPDGENIRQWQAREQQRQWGIHQDGIRNKENWSISIAHAVRDYRRRLERERERRKDFEQRAQLRPYRGNPWTRSI